MAAGSHVLRTLESASVSLEGTKGDMTGWQYWLARPYVDFVVHYQPNRRYRASFFNDGWEECWVGRWQFNRGSTFFYGKRRDTNLITGKQSAWFRPSDGGPSGSWTVNGRRATLTGANRPLIEFSRYTYKQFTTHPEAGRTNPKESPCLR